MVNSPYIDEDLLKMQDNNEIDAGEAGFMVGFNSCPLEA